MEEEKMYGISFTIEIIDGKNLLLKPYSILEGVVNEDGTFIDKYENNYKSAASTLSEDDYNNLYGFSISRADIKTFFENMGYPKSYTESLRQCANIYFEFAKRYIFILERDKNGIPNCYAINLYNKNSVHVDLDKNIMQQLMEDMVNEKNDEYPNKSSLINEKYNPKKILEHIKRRVIGQDEAAFALITTICKNLRYGEYEGMKSNVLLYGPSGCGKTELIRSLAKEMDLPVVIEDGTNYTANGYVGDSVKKILRRLYYAAGCDIKKAETGIIFLDEFDKLASTSSNKTVNKTDVQEELLKIIEGGQIDLNDSNKTQEELIIDTSKITFILGGAFANLYLDKQKKSIGFGNNNGVDTTVTVSNDDFTSYGILSEMVGRISTKIPIRRLTVEDLETILTKSSISCLRIYESALYSEDKVKVMYKNKKDFINCVAEKASKLNTGARGLKTVVDEIFLPAINEIASTTPHNRELLISSEMLEKPKEYVLRKIRRENHELSKGARQTNNQY